MARDLPPAPQAWAALATGLALGSVVLWTAPVTAFDWQPRLTWVEPWRIWSAAFTHLSPWHLQANLLGCAAVAAFGVVARLPRHATWAWLAAWPLTHAALVMQPVLNHYSGLSGVLHAGVAIGALHLVWHERGRRRAIGGAVLAGLALKLLLETPWTGAVHSAPGWDIPLAPMGHVSGALSGLVCGAAAQWLAAGSGVRSWRNDREGSR